MGGESAVSIVQAERTQRTGLPCLSMMMDRKGRCVRSVCREMVLIIPVSVSAMLMSARSAKHILSDQVALNVVDGVSVCLLILLVSHVGDEEGHLRR